jgi:hypothetical protein
MPTYTFDDKKHIHKLDDKPLCGVTTVLGVIAKPQLIPWAAKMTADYCSANVESGRAYTEDELTAIFSEAKAAHRKKKEAAGDWGSELHKAIECFIGGLSIPELKQPNQDLAYSQFVAWATDNKVEFLESEKHLYSEEHWIGGIVDMVFKMNGKTYIGDVKTGSGIYPEMWAQMGAYDLCLKEMGMYQDIAGYIIINLKKDGTIGIGHSENTQFNQNFFKAALELYKLKQIADKSVFNN